MEKDFQFSETRSLPRAELIDETPGSDFKSLLKKHKISDDEYVRCREIMGRAPTMAELGVFSSMWSEHCSYKSSRVHLGRFPTEGTQVVQGPGENAGIVRLSGKLCAAFKMESHNHPSYIEPYQGAATGVGGILRDVFCMGARPVANLNALRFGSREHERTHYLLENVVKGIGDYGNCVGIPTVGGNVSFDSTYDGNCLVNAMTVGLIHEDKIFRGYASGQGNLVVYLGSATGRDGIHGATMASDSFETSAENERSTVQVGDPFTEKLLIEATLEVLEKGLVVGLQDMGAAGLTSSSFEMADRAKSGLHLNLDLVPVRTTAMTAYELLLSESQERMLMVVEPGKWDQLQQVLAKWELACGVIGYVTDTGRVEAYRDGKLEIDIPVGPITESAPKYSRPMNPRPVDLDNDGHSKQMIQALEDAGFESVLSMMIADTGSKKPIYDQYDHHIGTSTVFASEDQGASVQWIRSDWSNKDDEYLGMLSAAVCNERYCQVNPRKGGMHAVLKAARMIAAAGGYPLAITDCLNFGNPEVPEVMWDFSEAVDGISEACTELNAPVVSGNVSLYNETDGKSIAPTPMIGMVGKMDDVRKALPAVVKAKGAVIRIGSDETSFGGSLATKLLRYSDINKGSAPEINWADEKANMQFVRQCGQDGSAVACRDIGDGGIALTLAKMAVPAKIGFIANKNREIDYWFGERSAGYLVVAAEGSEQAILDRAKESGVAAELLGTFGEGQSMDFGMASVPVTGIQSRFNASMEM